MRGFYKGLGVGLAIGVVQVSIACTQRETAKTEYEYQSKGCLAIYTSSAEQKSCLDYVRNKWTKAGAPPAAVDGGSHE